MIDIFIQEGRALIGSEIVETSLRIGSGRIQTIGVGNGREALNIDARDLLVMPGIVDLHGDAFERQMMPRPGVDFPLDVALIDSDRQAISNGITTVFHATTWSWEPGLRSGENAAKLLQAIERLRPVLKADTRFHLRHETYNLDAEDGISRWLSEGRIDLLAFNDHMESIAAVLDNLRKRQRMIERTGLSCEAFDGLVERVLSCADAVPHSIARLTKAARTAGVRMLSHDDDSPTMRKAFREQGVRIAEFPVNEETAREAAAGGDAIVFGAPNVVRGGSHTGWTKASEMIEKGLCSVLASDYYYPAPLLAAFRLAADHVLPLAQAWELISSAPARAAGLCDRGILEQGHRGDLLLVDDAVPPRPRVVAVIAAGQLAYLADADRLSTVCTTCSRMTRLYSAVMTTSPRYAIYYAAPRGSVLDRFGAELLGYDAWTGEDLPFPEYATRTAPNWRELTADPRKYGYHATLKAPFTLAHGKTEAELAAACAAFADKHRSIPVIRPIVDSIGGFVAVIPTQRSDELQQLAQDCVTAFDAFRAPLTAEDRARRNPHELTPRQRNHLDHWGYPYVAEEYRFHMTLTGRLNAAQREPMLKMLRDCFSLTNITTLAIDRIALLRQEATSDRFRIIGDWALRPASLSVQI